VDLHFVPLEDHFCAASTVCQQNLSRTLIHKQTQVSITSSHTSQSYTF